MRTTLTIGGAIVAVDLAARGEALAATVDDATHEVTVDRRGDHWRVTIGDATHVVTVARERDHVWIVVDGEVHHCVATSEARAGGARGGVGSPVVTAPMPGKVLEVVARPGQDVVPGDPLVVLEAMKMETVVVAEAAGRIVQVHVTPGAMVQPGQTLVEVQLA